MINLFLPCSCHVWLGAERTSVSCCLLQNMICLEMSMFIFPVFFSTKKKRPNLSRQAINMSKEAG